MSAPPTDPAIAAHQLSWAFPNAPLGPGHAVVLVPETRPGQRWPVVVALHGRAESRKPPERGALGWPRDYRLERAIERLARPPLRHDDFQGFVSDEYLEQINQSLDRHPYRGLIVACPYLPNRLKGNDAFVEAPALARYVADGVLARVRAETPALRDASATAVAGVSLGARAALLTSFQRPKVADHVGALQPAVDELELPRWIDLAREAARENPRQKLRVLTSDEDYYRDVSVQLHAALRDASLSATLETVRGDHSYRFNRGPGAIELLLYYDRVLRGERYLE